MKRSELVFAGIQIPLDYLALVASFVVSYWVRVRYPDFVPSFITEPFGDSLNYTPNPQLVPYQTYLPYILTLAGVMTLIFVLSGLYRWHRFPRPSETFGSVIRAVANAFLFILLIAFARGTVVLPRLVIVYALLISIVLLTLSRGIVAAARQLLHRWQIAVVRIAILGDGEAAERAVKVIKRNRRLGYRVSGTYDRIDMKSLRRAIRRRACDEVLVAGHMTERDLVELREYCIEHRVGLLVVPNVFTFLSSNMLVRDLAGFALIEIPVTPLEGWGYFVKRIFDILLSSVAIVLLSPLYLILALIVWADEPGPIFFRHKRLGEGLSTFGLWKYRTMSVKYGDGPNGVSEAFKQYLLDHVEEQKEWDKYQKLKHDPRVTRAGRVLRKLSLDELPQFFNVLKGDVSLVGPRPIVESELPKYGRLRYRLGSIKPGATGLWQVSGRNETTYEERVRLDMVYIENWSVWLDLSICLRTVWVMIFRRGAY
jgi:exopolysaccharide biosynthesis polyprenyl glycosylphosphotransferase